MMTVAKKVTQLNTPTINVQSLIKSFLNNKGIDSDHTKTAYETDIKQFFEAVEMDVNTVTVDELKKITHADVLNYKIALVKAESASSTVNRKLSSIKKLFETLQIDIPKLRPEIFSVGRVKQNVTSYGYLSFDEAKQMADIAYSKSEEKGVVVELAVATSLRLQSILDVTTNDIRRVDGIWVVKVLGKGKKFDEKPITDELYNKLKKLANGNGKIFNMSERTAQRMVKDACKEMGLSEDRNITFHSLKNVAINWILENEGDIVKASKQGNHANIQTTYQHYVNMQKKFGTMAGVLMYQEIDLSPIENLSHEELLDLIKKSSTAIQVQLVKQAKGLTQ